MNGLNWTTEAQVDCVRYVANQLNVSEADLAGYPYELTKVIASGQNVLLWELHWTASAPPGVKAHEGISRILAPIPTYSDQIVWPDDL